ncbi:hypothetical protein RN001_002458 [Aquatica leii]|uniref:Regulatory protein zeste n=1 Tax=Aquatica leii TaxID=1421715 RepID=A0AAN7SK59_9COLE|nr:hypothetical protein RN001_002458 [Aquatica leii]
MYKSVINENLNPFCAYTTPTQTKKIPPIFLHGSKNHKKVITDIKTLDPTSENYRKLSKPYLDNKIQFHKFNELNSRERSLNELKQQWRVLKGETKKCISTYQHELKKTGGGPKPPSPNQEILEIVDMIPNEFTTDENKFDSNYVVVPSDNTVDILESKEVEPCFSGNVDIKSNQVEPESSCFKVIQSKTPSCTTSVDEKKSLKRKLPLSEVTK